MKLQILINHWREPPAILGRMLLSIEEQRVCNDDEVEVLICTDGYENRLPDSVFAEYRTTIRYMSCEHRGVCATRNTLLDAADADYVMFCDCDDMFSRDDGLSVLLKGAREGGADIVGSCYDAEFMEEGRLRYVRMRRDIRRVHSKLFRLEYLRRERIRFPDEMAFSGDMYFLWLAYHLTEKIVWLDEVVYIWKWMEESVTRGEGKDFYAVRIYDKTRKCYMLTLDELNRRSARESADELVAMLVSASYLDWHSVQFRAAPADCAERARETIRESVHRLYDAYVSIPYEQRRKEYIRMLLTRRTYGPDGKFEGLLPWADAVRAGADIEERRHEDDI